MKYLTLLSKYILCLTWCILQMSKNALCIEGENYTYVTNDIDKYNKVKKELQVLSI